MARFASVGRKRCVDRVADEALQHRRTGDALDLAYSSRDRRAKDRRIVGIDGHDAAAVDRSRR